MSDEKKKPESKERRDGLDWEQLKRAQQPPPARPAEPPKPSPDPQRREG